jgi:hypothetical protein
MFQRFAARHARLDKPHGRNEKNRGDNALIAND